MPRGASKLGRGEGSSGRRLGILALRGRGDASLGTGSRRRLARDRVAATPTRRGDARATRRRHTLVRPQVAQVAGDYDYEGILRAELPGHDDRRGKLARQPTDGAKLVDASCQRRLARRELFRRLFAEMTDEERRVAWAEASLTTGYENLSEMELLQRALVNKRHVEAERAARRRSGSSNLGGPKTIFAALEAWRRLSRRA